MELLFESRTNVGEFSPNLRFVQNRPLIHTESVLVGDTFADRNGVTIYGSVLRDGGRFRMWYQTFPEDWSYDRDMASVGYAESDDEQRLYFSAYTVSHGFHLDQNWKRRDRWAEWRREHGETGIIFASWPKGRLFGFEADPDGSLTIDLVRIEQPSELLLNYTTRADGAVRVELVDREGHGLDDAVPLTGEAIEGRVVWKNSVVIHPNRGKPIRARVHLDVATVYAYTVRPVA